jgi:tyrosyl-tRNA synthetase
VGNLVPILLLAHFQRAGHKPVVLMGGGTGLIGDPSGKSAERQLLGEDDVRANIAGQRPIFERVLRFDGPNAAVIVNNVDWLGKLGFIEALRDIGKHFSVNMMIQRDVVRLRLEEREQGISYTEFSYMLLQAYDYLHLHDTLGVTVQMSGSDQWGNILGGVDLVRRVRQTEVFGLTAPLLTKADGTKFGKTEKGAVWLTADFTSPYALYQFWLNVADADVPRYLKALTLLPLPEVEAVIAEHAADPGPRKAQRVLARHLTELLHGRDAADQAETAAQALFSGDVAALPRELLDEVFASAPATTHDKARLSGAGASVMELLVETKVATSNRQAREFLSSGAVSVNGRKVELEARLTAEALLHGEVALLRRGKKTWHLTRWR